MKKTITQSSNSEVMVAKEGLLQVNFKQIKALKQKALHNDRQRIRLCAHRDLTDKIHEMIIVHVRDTYVPPHKHPNKTESLHIIEGEVDLVIFSEDGDIIDVVGMGDYASGHKMYCRLSEAYFHTLLIKSDFLVFHETINGPFNRQDTIFAPWAPAENDVESTQKYADQLKKKAMSWVQDNSLRKV